MYISVRLARILAALSAIALATVGVSARADTGITNVAHAAWGLPNARIAVDSNPVVLPVTDASAITIVAFHPDAGASGKTDYIPSRCRPSGEIGPLAAPPNAIASIGLAPAKAIRPGETFYFRLEAPFANRDPAVAETLIAVLTTRNGDRETLTIFETGPNTGIFMGVIATHSAPPGAVTGDCRLSLADGDTITVEAESPSGTSSIASVTVDVLIDPYGLVFDSEDGLPISGVSVTLIDAATGLPARVFAPDGIASWPSTVVTGQSVTDGAGNSYALPPGEYRFPLASPGTYRIRVNPAAPYTGPSKTTPAQLTDLTRPDGGALTIVDASYGGTFALVTVEPVRIDIPLDRPGVAVGVRKTASRGTAAPGDAILYTITATNTDRLHAKRGVSIVDALPPAMRLKKSSIRVDGAANTSAVALSADGQQITVTIGQMAPLATRVITYALEVRPDAPAGQAINTARSLDSRGVTALASVSVRITGETIAARMTLIGRVIAAGCDAKPPFAQGVPGVRVMLEDGSYAITDRDGRYHFEGLIPGTHVVQIDSAPIADSWTFVDCTRSTRSAGRATSRFVEGQGGTLAVADFHAVPGAKPIVVAEAPKVVSDREAAGAERDWFAGGSATIAWLYPEIDANPRAPVVRVAIRHLPGQIVRLSANGKPVDPITLDGTRDDVGKIFAVTLWRGIALDGESTTLSAQIIGTDGKTVATLQRVVHFSGPAAHADFLPERSTLIADGVHRPVVAVRLLDRNGRPLHQGSTGAFTLSAPYESAATIDADQARMLAGLERSAPTWRVVDDTGVALIELAPTSISGALVATFGFREHDQLRAQKIDLWLSPGDRPWTIVGLAEGRIGLNVLGDHLDPLAKGGDGVLTEGRLAFYAKGRVLGKWLLTASYDSAKRKEDQRLTGEIDPNAYYTVYADRSERRYDAASTRKLYLKLENRQFYAMFGDFVTGLNDTELGRYARSGTGFKAEFHGSHVQAAAFAAKFDTTHRRDEIQGDGLSGPYALSSRDISANSEVVMIEVRDRLRSDKIVDRRTLTRFIDYDIDYAAGTIRFSAPVLSRSSALDPQFIVVDYELYQATGGDVNAGGRATWTSTSGAVRIGATTFRDVGNQGATVVAAVDARVRIGTQTEIRAEAGSSGARATGNIAWLIEAEHHDSHTDVLAYARQQDAGYGVAQQNLAERGRRKIGIDGNIRLSDALSISGSAWSEHDLTSRANRIAARAKLEYRAGSNTLHLGIAHAEDRTDLVPAAVSTLVEAGATRAFDGGRLEVDVTSSFALGHAASVDFPAQHRLSARFAIDPAITLTGAYEIANGDAVAARTARVGFDVKPWSGARLTSSVGEQDIAEYGRRAFAAYGLAQSLQVSKAWSLDLTVDGNRTLRGIDATKIVNPAQPVAAGGFLGANGAITEDFTAVTVGATYRGHLWSATSRFEKRIGQYADRTGVTLGAIRQLGEGSVLGALGTWTRSVAVTGAETGTLDIAVSGAHRPSTSPLALLGKLTWREDRIQGGTGSLGVANPVGGTVLNATGDALSRRLVGSVSLNWAPSGRDENGLYQRSEFALFVGTRYVFDRIDNFDLAGLTTLIGGDVRVGLGDKVELGLSGTLRGNIGQGSFGYALGPSIGYRLATNMLVTAGWNVVGFTDRDFSAARTTRQGPFVSARIKFDETSFSFLGLTRQ